MGIEPTTSAWKAEVLPLNYTRIINQIYKVVCVADSHASSSASLLRDD